MGCLGVHFSISEEEVRTLRGFTTDKARLDYFKNELEEKLYALDANFHADSDKAWDAMHRALTDGQLDWDNGSYPLNHAVMGGENLYHHDDYIMVLKSLQQVRDLAKALEPITEADFRPRYFAIDTKTYTMPLSEDDFQYTWEWFQEVRGLFSRAAADGRWVLFTASQ
ncbi:MAG: YfbM family protein [Planctomycetota bacterium]